jgi:predicted alpha/beta-fold hydrolase
MMRPAPTRTPRVETPTLLELPPFQVHPLFRSAHLQTVIAAYLPHRRIAYSAKQHVVALADGDRLVLHDDAPPSWQPGGPIVLLIHGLGGSHRSSYVARAASKLVEIGVRSFRMDLRGWGAGYKLARKTVHAGRSEDIASALACIRKMCPASPVITVGYSVSGNMVLKMAGEFGEQVPGALDSVVSIAPPIDLHACSRNLQLGMNRFYDRHYVKRCLQSVEQRRREVPGALLRDLTPAPRTLREFDSMFTAPLGGFADVNDYYDQASAMHFVPKIRVPTLIITAVDDPVVPVECFERLSYPDSVHVRFAAGGGHLGFFGRAGSDPDRRWIDWRLIDWVKMRFGLSPQPSTCDRLL